MKIVKICLDEDCPECGFPEILRVHEEIKKKRSIELGKPLRYECSKRACNWEELIK